MKERIERVIDEMSTELTAKQLRVLQSVLIKHFAENIKKHDGCDNAGCLSEFLSVKGVEGCSSRTIKYYQVAIEHMLYTLNRPVREITNEDLRDYLVRYQKINNCSKVTLDNIRRNLSSNPALFVTLDYPYSRLQISGVEIRIRELGRAAGLLKIHRHKFRRTMATRAIDKGMPIEQVQKILGHFQIDTTMRYALVNQNNVKASHRRIMA